MIEVAQFVKGTGMSVQMNDVLTQIDKNGLYGFNASEGTVQVLDGKAKVLEESRKITLTKDKELALNSGPVTKAQNLDLKAAEADPLYVWSKVRSREQANENATLAGASLATEVGMAQGGIGIRSVFVAFLPGYGFIGSPFGWDSIHRRSSMEVLATTAVHFTGVPITAMHSGVDWVPHTRREDSAVPWAGIIADPQSSA